MDSPNLPHILYLDDETANLNGFYYSFHDYFNIHRTASPDEALDLLYRNPIKVVITDQRMPKISGTDFIQKVQAIDESLIFIILTGYANTEGLNQIISPLNVFGLVEKPYNEIELRLLIKSAINAYYLQKKNTELINQLKAKNQKLQLLQNQLENENIILKEGIQKNNVNDIITNNTGFIKLLSSVEQAASSDAPVLIQGDTGTGKELIAKAIHQLSHRSNKPMVTINCAALPESLIESELFGYEKGAFTGANNQKPGRFELANNGTLFLDEIGELPKYIQPKLLRILQEGTFERIGGTKTLKTNVRIIAATNQNLKQAIKESSFREDLYFRLNVFVFNLPSLSERKDDISLLTHHFIKKYNKKYNKEIKIIPKETMNKLINYPWPGNIRELENLVERSIITSPNETLIIDAISLNNNPFEQELLRLEDMERRHIETILTKTNWRIRGKDGAAERLGLKPTTLHSKIKKLGIVKNN